MSDNALATVTTATSHSTPKKRKKKGYGGKKLCKGIEAFEKRVKEGILIFSI